MSLLYGIKAVHPSAADDRPHILAFNTARTTADDSLFEVWNGSTSAAERFRLTHEGQVQGQDGSAAKPTYSFASDKDTGLYYTATAIKAAVGGSAVLTIDANGLNAGEIGAGTLAVARGGTGLASYAAGDLITATAATTLAKLAKGTARQLLQMNAGATAPEWASNIDIPGTLDVAGATTLDTTLAVTGVATLGQAQLNDDRQVRLGSDQDFTISYNGSLDYVEFRHKTANQALRITNAADVIIVNELTISGHGTTGSAANAFLDSGTGLLSRSTSSARYKKDMEPMTLEDARRMLALRPVTYRSKAKHDDPDRVFLGLVAEEVAAVDDRYVHLWDGKPDGVMYDRLVAPLLVLSGDHESRIRELEAELAALRN